MSLVRFSVAPHETLVDSLYGGLLYLCHVVTSVSLDLFRHESFQRLSACSPTPPGFSCHVVHFVLRKRFRRYRACFQGRFVPRKRFNLHRTCVQPCSLYIIPVTFSIDQVPCVLKRFPRTPGRNFVMSCVNRAFLLTGKILTRWGGRIETSLCPLMRPAGVEPLEVRFAHPVRLAPATHSQGHGRPCLQRLHLRRAFLPRVFILCGA